MAIIFGDVMIGGSFFHFLPLGILAARRAESTITAIFREELKSHNSPLFRLLNYELEYAC